MHTAVAAWRRWQHAAGPWRGWAVCPTLQLGVALAPSAIRPQRVRLGELGDVFAREGTAVILDVHPVDGVALAAEVNRKHLAHTVLVLPRWPHPDAVLACEELVTTLVSASRRLAHVHSSNVLFVLDGERRKSIAPRLKRDRRADNRYDIAATDLPDLTTLRRAGIQRVVSITRPA